VTGNAGVKAIVNQAVFTFEQAEPVGGHDQVQVTGFPANGTIAAVNDDFVRNFDRKLYTSAMTSP
jgi:hypothetical protein